MDEKFRIYTGIDVPSRFKLDDHANMIPVQQSIIKAKPLTDEVISDLGAVRKVEEVRPVVKEVVEDEEALQIYYRILEHISDRNYGKAYALYLDTGVSVADSDSFLEIFEDIINTSFHDMRVNKECLPLIYLLGRDFDFGKLESLSDFIRLAYKTFCNEHSPERSQRILKKLKGLFGDQLEVIEFES